MSTFLIGYRGSGKTTVGRKLADRLWQPFVDSDDEVFKRAGKSIKDIFEQYGEHHFRDVEAEVVKDLATRAEHVIALGGGAVLRDENRAAIKAGGHGVVYLKCDAKELEKRIHADPATAANRPSLTHLGGTLAEIEKLLAQREPIYRQVMTAELDVTNLSVDEVLARIARMV
jgi:shikimate kinase